MSLAVHAFNAVAVSRLALAMGLQAASAACAGLIFALWPLGAEPVSWVASLPDLLVAACVLMSTAVLRRGWPPAASASALLALTAFACLSKEVGAVAPIVAALLAYAAGSPVRVRELWLSVLVSCAYALGRTWHLQHDMGFPMSTYDIKEFIVRPFQALLVPVRASVANPLRWVFAVVNMGLAIGLAVRVVRSVRFRHQPSPPVALLVVAILVSVFPLLRHFYVSHDLEHSRYLYLASVPWTLLIMHSIEAIVAKRATLTWMLRAFAGSVLVVASFAMLRSNLDAWFRAAETRDRILAAVEDAVRGPCRGRSLFLQGVTDTERGAQVFRNGVIEALAERSVNVTIDSEQGATSCVVDLERTAASISSDAPNSAAPR